MKTVSIISHRYKFGYCLHGHANKFETVLRRYCLMHFSVLYST